MSHVFLSYSRRDEAVVDSLAAHVEQAGFATWVDRKGIAGGEQWRKEIVAAIQSASLMALFLSTNSTRSDNVRKEIDLAEQARVRILPVAIMPIQIPAALQYQLAGVQVIELWRDQSQAASTFIAALQRQGVPRGQAGAQRAVKATPSSPNVNLADLGGSRLLDLLNIKKLMGR